MNGVVRWFVRRGEVPLVPPPRLREYVPLADDPDRFDPESSLASISGVAFVVEYCDARGFMSTRTLRCLAINPHHPATLTAYCHVRERVQSFRIDRIISVIDLRSGNILSGDGHMALLAPHLPESESRPDLQPLFALQRTTRNGVFALLQLAMGDGRLNDVAREIVLGYVSGEAAASACPMPAAGLVELWIDNLAPPLEAVAAAVTGLLSEREKFARLLPWLMKLVRSQDDFAVQEESLRELIDEVREHFRRKLLDWPGGLRATR